jgi:hypothetical protein
MQRAECRLGQEGKVRLAALIVWCTTAALGLGLVAVRRSGGGTGAAGAARDPAAVAVSHGALALAGLALWTRFVAGGGPGWAWTAFGLLCGSVLLGLVLVTQWLTGIGGRHARPGQRPVPAWLVSLYGLGGLAAFIVVLVTATICTPRLRRPARSS